MPVEKDDLYYLGYALAKLSDEDRRILGWGGDWRYFYDPKNLEKEAGEA